MWWQHDKRLMWNMRAISNEPKWMLPKCTHLCDCKVNEKTSLYEHSNESIENNVYWILMMRWEIIYWAMVSSYYKPTLMMYELNVMELYTLHQKASYERWCLLSGRADVHLTLMIWDCLSCWVWVSLYLRVFEPILLI